jgi:hypothetical protein
MINTEKNKGIIKLMPLALLLISAGIYSCNSSSAGKDEGNSPPQPQVELTNHEDSQKVDVLIDGKLFTSYCYSDTLMKQILYPIFTIKGNPVTRGWPIKPRAGEQTDHPHQRGMWLNYGDVNGYDFWGNSYAIAPEVKKVHEGRIKHLKIEKISSGAGEGTLVTHESWISPFGHELLSEKTTYHFIAKDSVRIIDRITTLTATDSAVTFKDTKEGMFAIRYNRYLKLPAGKEETFTDALGNRTTVAASSKEATGNYRSSEGVTGLKVWGTRAMWMDLFGNINGEKISLAICDHPGNFDYPTYWHARGYGLFAANPFGAHDFTDGKRTVNYTLPKGQSLTFRYRVIISSGMHLTGEEINEYANAFAKMY